MLKGSGALLLGALLLAGSATARSATVTVDAVPGGGIDANGVVAAGATFSVNVLIGDVLDLAGFQFDLAFDATRIEATGIVSGGLFDPDTFLIADTVNAGSVTFAETTVGTGLDIAAPALLATIEFRALAAGSSLLALSGVLLSDSVADPIDPVTLVGASIAVSPASAPIPATIALWSIGCLALGLSRRRATRPGRATSKIRRAPPIAARLGRAVRAD